MMIKIKKFYCLLIAAILIFFPMAAITACHGSREKTTFEIPDAFDTTQPITITFWAKNDTNKTQTDIYKQAIADFQEIYPNITVNLRLYTNYGTIYNDVITNIATNTTPNVCITYPDHIATYLTGANTVVPLDGLFADEQYGLGGSEILFDSVSQEEIVSKFLDECRFQDAYYAIPYMRSTEACYINKTYVEALGYTLPNILTWDFIWEVSEAAMAKNEDGSFIVNGQNVLIPFIYKSTDNMMIQMLKQRGAGYSTEDGKIELFNDTTTDLLYMIAEHGESRAFSTFKISSYPANFLNAGQCIFAIDSTAGATWMGSNAPLSDISEDQKVDFETVVMPIPQFDPANTQMISQGPSICIFNKSDPQEVLASWIFAQYLLTNDVQIAYAETEGYIPVTTRARSSAEYQDYLSRSGEDNSTYYDIKIAASMLLLDYTADTFVTPVFNGSASLRDAAGQLIENTVKSVRRGETIDGQYIETLYSDIASMYHLNKTELGPLPYTAVILLASLAVVWVLILIYVIFEHRKKKRN